MSGPAPSSASSMIPGPSYGADVEEYLQIPGNPDEMTIEDDGAGGALVTLPGTEAPHEPEDGGFYENLAAILPDAVKSSIVSDLLQRLKEDEASREERDKQYEEGIKRTGLGKDAPGGASFQGASKVVHPMMTEAAIDYQSRIMKELMPPSGPAKPHMIGSPTREKEERARRKAEHMNWQITQQMPEARSVLETVLTQVPLGGSQFIYQWYDRRLKRPRWEFASVDKIVLPANAADFASAPRKAFKDVLSEVEYRQRVQDGMYVDVGKPPSFLEEPTASQAASMKVEGVEMPATNLDGDREYYLVMTYLDVSEETAAYLRHEEAGDLRPYLITIDVGSRQMAAMYRNWEDGDEAAEPIEHFFEFPFLPWRGALSIGLPHIIGGLSATATGSLRALLDSAHANNMLGGFILKGSGASGQNRSPEPGEFVEIDGGMEAQDIRKVVMPNAITPPSPVLFQLLGAVTEMAKGVVRTSLDDAPAGQGNTPVPVGTQMSRVEEGLTVFSACHGRAHAAMNRLLKGLHRLNRLYLPDVVRVDATGKEVLIRREDYEGHCDVQPVSDPNIYSDQQRLAQLQYIQSRMMAVPGMYNARAVELACLKIMKWPDPEQLLVAPADPEDVNAITENLQMGLGKAAEVFPEQDHLAHIQAHLDFLQSPALGALPMIAPAFLPRALPHIAKHILYFYATHTIGLVEQAAQAKAHELEDKNTEVRKSLDQLLALAGQKACADVAGATQQAIPVLMQAFQHLQALQPKPPMDPALAAVQAAQAETARKAAADQAGAQQDQAELQTKTQLAQQANAIAADRVAAIREGQQIAAQTKLATTQQDTNTAIEIADMKAESGRASDYTDGGSLTGQ